VTEEQEQPPRPWSARAQVLAAVLWPSLLAASFATMLFFAAIDPESLHDGSAANVETSRMTAYGITFFFFWLVAALSSAVSVYLVRSSPGTNADRND
jgi:hypothetical protein